MTRLTEKELEHLVEVASLIDRGRLDLEPSTVRALAAEVLDWRRRSTLRERAWAELHAAGELHYRELARRLYPDAAEEVRVNRITSLLQSLTRAGRVDHGSRRGLWRALAPSA